ncbi:MAG: TIGR00730 family Rossman fold protein [Phycisphaerales bacterium]|nr:TIGR00730 family Rossman fold protein [Phycisphaerales bacterium]
MPSVTVYCASSQRLDPAFHDAARIIGGAIAARGFDLVYGGGSIGLMGEIARAARAGGGRVVGIITHRLLEMEQGWDGCDELVVVDTMRERKRLLAERGDAFVILPGGIGTYEEFFEILVGRQLGEHDKPIGIVNAHGYFNPLVAMIEHAVEHRFVRDGVHDLFVIDPDPAHVLAAVGASLADASPPPAPTR